MYWLLWIFTGIYFGATIRSGRKSLSYIRYSRAVGERARVRGRDAPVGGSGVLALSGCVGHASYGIPELEERSVRASQVLTRRESRMGNCACGSKGTARCVCFELSTSDEGKM
eukprot:6095307-Pleurochrysis_carterae.AAC.3